MRWDLIEKFEVLKKGSHSRAVCSFTGKEDFFLEHFPGRPLVPEALMIEMVAQAGGVLLGLGVDFKKEVILAKINTAEFSRAVAPPCRLVIEARLEEENEQGGWVSGHVHADGSPAAKVELLLATVGFFEPDHTSSVVFNDHFLKHYDVYAVARSSERVS